MVETYTRKRSKSAPRRRSRSTSKSKPIVLPKEKNSMEINEKPTSSEEVYVVRRVTRQSKLIESKFLSQIDDNNGNNNEVGIETDNGNIKLSDNRNMKKFDQTTVLTRFQCFFKLMKSSLFCCMVFSLIPVVFLLNKMTENGARIRYIDLREIKLQYFTDYRTILVVVCWLIYLAVLAHIPIGKTAFSTTKKGTEVQYRFNGFVSMIITIICLTSLVYTKILTSKLVYDNYYFLIGSSISVAFIFLFILLLKSYLVEQIKITFSPINFVYNFIVGREINPRCFGLDLKFFYEFRPGFTSWMILNIIFCLKDLEEREFKSINFSLLFCSISQILYCLDAVMFEGDIISKPFMANGQFGFFHCLGNQVIVPFLFTLTTRAIQINNFQLPFKCIAGIAIINLIGYIIYRSSNIQKNSFRRNPYCVHLCHLKTITNHHGHQILVGGWWGLLRHPNYFGDVIICLSWSLYAGLNFGVCWFYPIYFLLFIVIRCVQDDRKCAIEHGEAWREYHKAVQYRLIPFIF